MRPLTRCAMFGVAIVVSLWLATPAGAQTPGQGDVWVPDNPNQFAHGWFWDPTDEAWKYGWYQPGSVKPPSEYTLTMSETRMAPAPMPTELRGRVVDIEQRRSFPTAPAEIFVTVRTEDGTIRTIDLGSAQFVYQNFPELRRDQQVLLRGELDRVAGRDFFSPQQLVTAQSALDLPQFGRNQRVRGTLANLYTVPGEADFQKILVAQVRTYEGDLLDVMLGPTDVLGNQFYTLQPGTEMVAEGYVRQTPSGATLYAQNVRVQQRQPSTVVTPSTSALVMNVEPAPSVTVTTLPPVRTIVTQQLPADQGIVTQQLPAAQAIVTQPQPAAQTVPFETIQGQILDLYTVWTGTESHLFVDIDTANGRLTRIDLGPSRAVSVLNLNRGDLVTISGQRLIQADGAAVFAATTCAAGGQTVTIQTAPQLVGALETAPVQQISGIIVDKQTVDVAGYRDRHVIIYLQLNDGQVIPVDLGAKDHLKGMDLDRNDTVTVWARPGDVQGQPGLIGVELQHENKHATLSPFE